MIKVCLLAAVLVAFIFSLGVLVGATWAENVLDARSRRQAARQYVLNNQVRQLREQWALLGDYQATSEEDMRWHAKRQAGLVVIDYEADD